MKTYGINCTSDAICTELPISQRQLRELCSANYRSLSRWLLRNALSTNTACGRLDVHTNLPSFVYFFFFFFDMCLADRCCAIQRNVVVETRFTWHEAVAWYRRNNNKPLQWRKDEARWPTQSTTFRSLCQFLELGILDLFIYFFFELVDVCKFSRAKTLPGTWIFDSRNGTKTRWFLGRKSFNFVVEMEKLGFFFVIENFVHFFRDFGWKNLFKYFSGFWDLPVIIWNLSYSFL